MKQGWERNKIRGFQNDVLISLAAHRNGMTVITNNRNDYQLINAKIKIKLEIW